MNTINNNLMAVNVANNLNAHYGRLSTSVERLSSGLRINSAADDAAGLAIRELLRADVAAFHQGVRNANDGISMLQVADGALSVIDEKLIRMKELAEQAASGTYNSTQRLIIDSEFQAMGAEIDRIAMATDFNGIKILDGKFESRAGAVDPNRADAVLTGSDGEEYNVSVSQSWHSINGAYLLTPATAALDAVGDPAQLGEGEYTFTFGNSGFFPLVGANKGNYIHMSYTGGYMDRMWFDYDAASQTWSVTDTKNNPVTANITGDASEAHFEFAPETLDIKVLDENGAPASMQADYRFSSSLWKWSGFSPIGNLNAGTLPSVGGVSSRNLFGSGSVTPPYDQSVEITMSAKGAAPGDPPLVQYVMKFYSPSGIGSDLRDFTYTFKISKRDKGVNVKMEAPAVTIHFGPGNDSAEDYYEIRRKDATLKGLGLEGATIKTQDSAQKTLARINEAIVIKDGIRAEFGAMQNRLENTVTNLTIQGENLQNAESRISDTDVALEMMNFVRNQVLTQSAVAMLGQANSYPHILSQLING